MTVQNFILPHRTIAGMRGLLDEVERLKGTKSWYEFDLECLLARYPDSKPVAGALADVRAAQAKAKRAGNSGKKGALVYRDSDSPGEVIEIPPERLTGGADIKLKPKA